MKVGKNNGISRRPVEYVMWLVIFVLIVVLLFALSVIRKDSKTLEQTIQEGTVLTGTLDEIDQITEQEVETEQESQNSSDEEEEGSATADSAADNFSGVYDEATN